MLSSFPSAGEAPDARVVQVRGGGLRVHVAGGGRHAAPHGARARPRRQEQGRNRDDDRAMLSKSFTQPIRKFR